MVVRIGRAETGDSFTVNGTSAFRGVLVRQWYGIVPKVVDGSGLV